MVAIVTVAPSAKARHTKPRPQGRLQDGEHVEDGGDHDDSPAWDGESLDTNEFILTLRLRAPNLVITGSHRHPLPRRLLAKPSRFKCDA